jgi:hypothetical protein
MDYIRLPGVYGPCDMTILGRTLEILSHKITRFAFISIDGILMDFVHIKNVTKAHLNVSIVITTKKSIKQKTAVNGVVSNGLL